MSTIVTVLAPYDYKYEPAVWRKDVAETFQQVKEVHTDYTVVDGQVVKTVEHTFEFQSALAAKSDQLPDPPPTFLYADATYRKDAAYIFQNTHIVTTTDEAYGSGSYLETIEDLDVLKGTVKETVSVIDGKIPLAPTINSALSNLILQPSQGELDGNCGYIDQRKVIEAAWVESDADAARVARREWERENAIVRRVGMAANPLMRIGHTVRLISPKHLIDARHVVTGRAFTIDENGGAAMIPTLEFWPD